MITIESPTDLTLYFSSNSSQNHVWAAFDGPDILGWHPDKKQAQNLFKGVSLVKIYKSLKG